MGRGRGREGGGPRTLSFKINDHHPRRRRRGCPRFRITEGRRNSPVRFLRTTYQAYRSQNDLRSLNERDRIERGPGLSAAVRSAVHLSATEAERRFSKLTQRASAHAQPPRRQLGGGGRTRRHDDY